MARALHVFKSLKYLFIYNNYPFLSFLIWKHLNHLKKSCKTNAMNTHLPSCFTYLLNIISLSLSLCLCSLCFSLSLVLLTSTLYYFAKLFESVADLTFILPLNISTHSPLRTRSFSDKVTLYKKSH